MLAVDRISRSFAGQRVVSEVSFSVAPGEMVALIGPNGAGKTTCFNMVGGQLRPDSGSIRLDGTELRSSPRAAWRRGVGRTFQITATFGSMTLRENLQMALTSHAGGVWRGWRPMRRRHAAEADALLGQVELTRQAGRAASTLAYGDLKRLELAMALSNAPRLLLMDEPTAGMAPSERTALMQLTRRLATMGNIAVLFTEHDMDVVFSVADRILVLDHGRVIAEGDGPAVRADPRVREVYLGAC